MNEKYKHFLLQTGDVIHMRILTPATRKKAHSVIVDFIQANPQMTYPEVADVFGLHPVTVNRIALEGGVKRGSGRRPVTTKKHCDPAFGK